MKGIILIIAFFALLIGIQILLEASDTMEFNYTTEMNLPNPALKSVKVELPLYKTLKYEFGCSRGICIASQPLKKVNYGNPFGILEDNLNWFNAFDISILLPEENLGIGFEYGWWPYLMNREGLTLGVPDSGYAYVEVTKWAIYYYGIFLNYYPNKLFYCGILLNHFKTNAEEVLVLCSIDSIPVYSYRTNYAQRKCIGGTVYCGLEKHVLLNKFELIPFIKLQIGYAKEYHNNSQWEWGDRKLTIGTSGIFLGINMRFGGER